MPPRFFVPGLDPSARVAALPPHEATHLRRVLRLGPGAVIQVFDGQGQEWRAEVTEVTGHAASVRVLERLAPAPEASVAVTLVMAVLKGDKMDAVVRDAVMLGAAAIRPVITTRTEVGAARLGHRSRLERWQRIAVASAKQCGRAVVPQVHPWQPFEAYLESAPEEGEVRLLLVEPGAGGVARPLRAVAQPRKGALLVGPEGGWTDEEITRAVGSGATSVRLGARTLRADAAPLVALAMIQVLWDDRGEESRT